MTLLSASGVTVRYGTRLALDGFTLDLDPGAFLVLCGPSGAGKSIALAALAGIVRLTGGRVTLDGHDVHRDRAVRRRIGYCAPATAFGPGATIREDLLLHARCQRVDRDEQGDVVAGLLELFDLRAVADEPADALSPGTARRLHMARAFVHDPDVVLLDDPFLGMDDESRMGLTEVLSSMTAHGKTIVVATSRPDDLDTAASAFAVLDAGRLTTVRAPTNAAMEPKW